LTYTLGRMTGSQRHGWAIWAAMAVFVFRQRDDRLLGGGQRQSAFGRHRPGRLARFTRAEIWRAKKLRFGIANSALFATVTTDASCGAVNGMHDSFTPLGGMVPLIKHHAWRSRIWRCRCGALRHFRFRRPRRVHCRADGRPNTRISGQENRGVRRKNGHARRPHPDMYDPNLFRHLSGPAIRHCGA